METNRIAHTKGEHVWHVHEDTDELFLVRDASHGADMAGSDRTDWLDVGEINTILIIDLE